MGARLYCSAGSCETSHTNSLAHTLPNTPRSLPLRPLLCCSNNNAHSLLTLFYLTPQSEGVEPIPDAIAVNGHFSRDLHFAPPTRHSKTLFRVIASNAFSMYSVSIDGVNLQVVEADATTVKTFELPSIMINTAMRCSFIVDWSTLQSPPNSTGSGGGGGSPNDSVFIRVLADESMYAVEDMVGYVPPYEAPLVGAEVLDPLWLGVVQFSPTADDGGADIEPSYDPTLAPGTPGGPPAAPAISYTGTIYAGIDQATLIDVMGMLIDESLLHARPKLPMAMPAGTHGLYIEILFYNDEYEVNRGHMNRISHVHNMEGGLMPSLFSKTVYGTPQGGAAQENPANYRFRATRQAIDSAPIPPSGQVMLDEYAANGVAPQPAGTMPSLAIPYTDESHYLLPPGAVVVVLINSQCHSSPLQQPNAGFLSSRQLSVPLRTHSLSHLVRAPHAHFSLLPVAPYFTDTDGGDHPFHAHGHTVWLMATSEMPEAETLYAANYQRRDTISIPGFGWAKVRCALACAPCDKSGKLQAAHLILSALCPRVLGHRASFRSAVRLRRRESGHLGLPLPHRLARCNRSHE